jgi:hypothetical protein
MTIRDHRHARMPPDDQRMLRALIDQAWELRGTPYMVDACQAINDWHERRHLRAFERGQELQGEFLRWLQEQPR